MTQEQINKYSVLMAEFMGWKLVCLNLDDEDQDYVYEFHRFDENNQVVETDCGGDSWMYGKNDVRNYANDYNELMKVWFKFRYLNIKILSENNKWFDYALKRTEIRYTLTDRPIEEAFEELGKAIEWYNTIKK